MIDPALRLDEDECRELFAALFPHGFGGEDVRSELAPAGWEASPLAAIAHPSPVQLYEESVRMHRGIESPFAPGKTTAKAERASDKPAPRAETPSLEKIRAEYQPTPVDPPREVRDLVGLCVWDIFSNNHEVAAPDGRIVDLGSHRAAGGFLAEIVNLSLGIAPDAAEEREIARMQRLIGLGSKGFEALFAELAAERESAERVYDYMDFYMGSQMVARRADLGPVYRMIFRRLRCDWRYSHPRLFLADLRPLRDALNEQNAEQPAWRDYDPSAALAAEDEERSHDEEVAGLRAKLDEAYRESVVAAQDQPPPCTVAAYRDVYGSFPAGWPPEIET